MAQNPNNRNFVNAFEKRVKKFAEPALDKCYDDAETVWTNYLNKALLGLTVIDSFFDAVVIWDDIVVDSTTKDCDDIALAVGKMGIAVNAYLGELSLKPWAAMVIDTESQLLAAYPLKEGAVLVCILDKSAHESVWRRDIPAKLERIQENLEL